MNYTLTLDEKQFLLRKYMKKGLDFKDAKKKVSENQEFLRDVVKRLKQKKLSDKELNKRFRKEFEKLCREY